jgi:asparagine synthase (glutamine-hydrolysing)
MLGNHHKIVVADTSRVLRRAVSGVLPDVVLNRRDKLGFATPEEIWFRAPLRDLAYEDIQATLSRYLDLFNANGTKRLATDMLDGTHPVDFTLWRIVNLGIWGERCGASMVLRA